MYLPTYYKLVFLCFLCMAFNARGNADSLSIFKIQFDEKIERQQFQKAYDISTRLYEHYWKHPDTLLLWANRRYDLASKIPSPYLEVKSLYEISHATFLTGKHEASIPPAEKADSILQLHPADELKVEILYRLAEGYEYTGRPELGMQKYSACYALAEKLGQKNRLLTLDLKLGDISKYNQEIEKAIDHYHHALNRIDKQESIGWYMHVSGAIYNLKLANTHLYDKDKLIQDCDSIFAFYKIIKKDKKLEVLGSNYFELFVKCISSFNNQEELKKLILPTLDQLLEEYSNREHLLLLLNGNFEMALLRQDFNRAEEYVNGLYDLVIDDKGMGFKLNALRKDKMLKTAQKKYEALIPILNKIHEIEFNLQNEERRNSVSNLEGVLAAKEKESEIKLLNKDKEILTTQSQQRFLMALGFALISLLGFGFFWNAQRKNKIIAAQNTAISQKNIQLEQLNTTKDRIFAIIGHDLRKPAIAFRGITKKVNYLLKKEDYKTLNALGKEIEQDALALNKLTDNLLNWALLQRDVLPHNPQLIEVEHIVEEINSLFAGKAKDKNIELTYNIPDRMQVYADANALRTVVRNLVDNALKYTPTGGQVTIEAVGENKETKIRVSDTGVGIPDEKIKAVFLLKKEKSEAGTAGEKGTGLGMHLVNELVKLNQGTIQVMSQLNRGTTFEVLLPRVA